MSRYYLVTYMNQGNSHPYPTKYYYAVVSDVADFLFRINSSTKSGIAYLINSTEISSYQSLLYLEEHWIEFHIDRGIKK